MVARPTEGHSAPSASASTTRSASDALDRLPGRLIVHAVEAADLSQGTGLTPAVAAVIDTLATAVLRDLRS